MFEACNVSLLWVREFLCFCLFFGWVGFSYVVHERSSTVTLVLKRLCRYVSGSHCTAVLLFEDYIMVLSLNAYLTPQTQQL